MSLESLDARFQPPKDPAKLKKIISSVPPHSRWNTTEFKVYILVFIVVVPLMFKQGMDISQSSHPNYEKYAPLLSEGWLFGRKVDNSDAQYSFFRNNFWLLMTLASIHVAVKRISVVFDVNKIKFDMVFGLVFLAAAHGLNSVKNFFHIMVCYGVVRGLISLDEKNKYSKDRIYKYIAIGFLWTYGILALYVNDKLRDAPLYGLFSARLAWMDQVKGLIPRWDVFYNFTLLRTISFNVDYLDRYFELKESVHRSRGIQLNTISQEELLLGNDNQKSGSLTFDSDISDKDRMTYSWSIKDYNIETYLAYVLYTPLFIVGPILTFNDYLYQTRSTLSSINAKRISMYAMRFCLDILTMEFILHFMYVVAIARAKIFENYTPFQISMIGLFNLNVIWLKLLIPWRFFRLWAMLDQIDAPENMIRCVDNNYSALAFWRAWHRSFNKWITRYIYIPLGGSNNRILTSLAVFSFVAIWHDIEFRMLIWGWLIVLFLLPEILLSSYFKRYNSEPWYRHACGVGSVVNIWLMMLANIYGFCLGHDGTVSLLKSMFMTIQGGFFFIVCSACLFVGVQAMYEFREAEKRRGIDVRC